MNINKYVLNATELRARNSALEKGVRETKDQEVKVISETSYMRRVVVEVGPENRRNAGLNLSGPLFRFPASSVTTQTTSTLCGQCNFVGKKQFNRLDCAI